MKNRLKILLGLLFFLFFVLVMPTCQQQKYVEIKGLEDFSKLDLNQVEEIDIKSMQDQPDTNPENWEGKYRPVFPISDSEKIQRILYLIRNSKPLDYYTMGRVICFRIKNTVYWMGFELDSERAYGSFWESEPLRQYLEILGLHEPPGSKNLIQEPNDRFLFPPPVPYEGEIPSDKAMEKYFFIDEGA